MDRGLHRTIASELQLEPHELTSDRELASIDTWDSLMTLSIAVVLGDALGLKVQPAEMFTLRTFEDLEALVRELEGRGSSSTSPWRRLVETELASAPDIATRAVALVAGSGAIDADSALYVGDALDPYIPDQATRLTVTATLRATGLVPANIAVAQLEALGGSLAEAISTLTKVMDRIERPDPELLATRARWLVRVGRMAEAAVDLQTALALDPAYGWFARNSRVLDQVVQSHEWEARRSCRLAILSTATTTLLAHVLQSVLFRDRVRTTIYEPPFGSAEQELRDPSSMLYEAAPEIVVIVPNHRDLAASDYAEQLTATWTTLRDNLPCHIVQVLIDAPVESSGGILDDSGSGLRRVVAACNEQLRSASNAGVSFLDADALGVVVDSRNDWDASKQYPAAHALPEFANAIAAHVRAVLGLTSKLLVLDLDNTMWGGVIGEDGVGGLALGPPSAEGEGYVALQQYARELKERGVLLAVASKNNPLDAEEPFKQHDAMVLRLDDFVAFRASWNDKASMLREIADELSLGLDAMVFVDDNPLERAWVRRQLPMVIVPEVDANPWSMRRALTRGRYFDVVNVTSEDLERSSSYRATSAIRSAASTSSIEDFLNSLDMVVEHGSFDEITIPRLVQLINKSNQFNLTTRRVTMEQLRKLAASPEAWCRWFRVKDRFGDHGLVGVLIATTSQDVWSVDTWLMSCRVLGRRIEHFMCATMLAAAAAAGAKRIIGEYIPTKKNDLVSDLFSKMGFASLDEDPQRKRFGFELGVQTAPTAPWIRSELA